MDKKNFEKPEYYVNRELSWLKFDDRVLSEARDKNLPLFERLKFLSITSSNLDEFYMVRVASLKDQVHADYEKKDIAGMTPKEQLKEISAQTHELVNVQYNTLNRSLLPALEKAGFHLIARHEDLNQEQQEYVDRYFEDNVYPVLTPMAMDSSRPFPLIRNKTLNIAALLKKKNEKEGLNPEAVNNIVDLQDQTGEDIKVEDFQGVYDGNVIPFSTTPHSTKKSLIGKIKGIFDDENKQLKKLDKMADQIIALESTYESLTDEQLANKTNEFKEALANGKTLDDIIINKTTQSLKSEYMTPVQ